MGPCTILTRGHREGLSFLTHEDTRPDSSPIPDPEGFQGMPHGSGCCVPGHAGHPVRGTPHNWLSQQKAGAPGWALGLWGIFHCTCTPAAEATCSNISGRVPPHPPAPHLISS